MPFLRFAFYVLVCCSLGHTAGAQYLSSADVERLFRDRTTFGFVNADRRSWNAFYAADGTAIYWSRDFKITRGTWWVSRDRLCVNLRDIECRTPFLRSDGMIDWINPGTDKATSTLVRIETGDVLGLRRRLDGTIYQPEPVYDGQYQAFDAELSWVQTHSFRELFPAMQMAAEMRDKGFKFSVVSSARNGWHAVLLGSLQQDELDLVEDWKRQGLVPQDTRTNATKRFYKFDTPPVKPAVPKSTSLTSSQAQTRPICTKVEYEKFRQSCFIVFAGEQGCSAFFSGEYDDLAGRSASIDPLCSAAMQYLIEGEINLAAVGISFGAGVLDDLGDEARASGGAFGQFIGDLFELGSLATTVGGLNYCLSTVDDRCGI